MMKTIVLSLALLAVATHGANLRTTARARTGCPAGTVPGDGDKCDGTTTGNLCSGASGGNGQEHVGPWDRAGERGGKWVCKPENCFNTGTKKCTKPEYQNNGVTDTERAAVMKKEAAVATADQKDDTAARAVKAQAAARTDEDFKAQGAAFSANKKDDEKLKVEDAAAVTGQVALDALAARKLARAASDAKDDAADAKRVSDERGGKIGVWK